MTPSEGQQGPLAVVSGPWRVYAEPMRLVSFPAAMALLLLGACAEVSAVRDRLSGGEELEVAPETPPDIADVVAAPPPRSGANTADALDTTTEEQRAAATAAPESEGQALGEVTASLGDPTDPGIWMRTGLVSSRQSGRVEVADTGRTATVELIPLDGDGGAQLSLAAMRILQVPLTELPSVRVFRQ